MKLNILLILFFSFLFSQKIIGQVNGYMIFKKGINVTLNLTNLNRIQNGIRQTDFTEIEVAYEDITGGPNYTGFALYVHTNDLFIDGNFGADQIPLSKIKFTCTGDLPSGTYVTDTSMINAKLTSSETAICYWPSPGEGTPLTGTIRITYFCEAVEGYIGDIYLTDLNISLKSYTTVPF